MSVEISSVFSHHKVAGYKSELPSMTVQSEKNACDINVIVDRYLNHEIPMVDPMKVRSGEPQFGDFSDIPDLQTAQNKLIEANEMFMELPAKVRKRFDNDPTLFVEFVQDYENNKDEMVELGILPKVYKKADGSEYYFRDGLPVYITPPSVDKATEVEV